MDPGVFLDFHRNQSHVHFKKKYIATVGIPNKNDPKTNHLGLPLFTKWFGDVDSMLLFWPSSMARKAAMKTLPPKWLHITLEQTLDLSNMVIYRSQTCCRTQILLMEKILHHLGSIEFCTWRDIYKTTNLNWLAAFLNPSTVCSNHLPFSQSSKKYDLFAKKSTPSTWPHAPKKLP